MSIADNIKRRRLELGLSQQELADVMGYSSRSTIAKIEAGINDVPQSKIVKFSRALDTSVDYLMTGVDSGYRQFSALNENALLTAKKSGSNRNAVIVLAGGKSTRNLQNIPNQFINVLGKPVIIYVLEAYQRHPVVDDIYVVCLKGWESILDSYVKQYGITKLVDIIQAGETGIKSVCNGLIWLKNKALYAPDDIIILQESTRPLITEEIISKMIFACSDQDNAVVCEPMSEYLQFYIEEKSGTVTYIDRNCLLAVQSPEAHKFGILEEAFDKAQRRGHELDETCCAMMMHNLGYKLNFCEGNHNNIKIVRQEDIAILNILLRQI